MSIYTSRPYFPLVIQGNLSQNGKCWEQKLHLHLAASRIVAFSRKLYTQEIFLVTLCGEEALTIYNSFEVFFKDTAVPNYTEDFFFVKGQNIPHTLQECCNSS